MARQQGGDRIYALIERWREECLVGDGSLVFPGESVWPAAALDKMFHRFNENQIVADRTFEDKFCEQLADDRAMTRLGAECLIVYFAFAFKAVRGPRKIELISQVLGWGGDKLELPDDVTAAMDGGIGNPGRGFNNNRPDHLAYVVSVVREFKGLDGAERRARVADGWTFREWLVGVDGEEQMMRHILLHLLFPDQFERVAITSDKDRIVEALGGLLGDEGDIDGDNVDRTLYEVRARAAQLLGRQPDDIDFYEPQLREA